jgi:methylphosphotriester-DNA--protein-cysteine methyltransferase
MRTLADSYYEAMLARDYRFDGKFFVGVKTRRTNCLLHMRRRASAEVAVMDTGCLGGQVQPGYRPALSSAKEGLQDTNSNSGLLRSLATEQEA